MEDAAGAGSERAVVPARRAAGVGRREALLPALALPVVADDEVALHDVHLLPVVVHERLGRERAGLDLQEARAAAPLRRFIQIAGENLLEEPRRVARRHLPPRLQVDLHEFQVLLGFHGYTSSVTI